MDKIAYKFDPEDLTGEDIPRGRVREAMQEIGEFVKEQVLSYVGDAKSPVSGGKWKRSLSKSYKEYKSEFSSSTIANMELTGSMLDALEVVSVGGELELRIQGEEAAKADGHNNFSGSSNLPLREFIPKPSQTFKRDIIAGIRKIIQDYQDEEAD